MTYISSRQTRQTDRQRTPLLLFCFCLPGTNRFSPHRPTTKPGAGLGSAACRLLSGWSGADLCLPRQLSAVGTSPASHLCLSRPALGSCSRDPFKGSGDHVDVVSAPRWTGVSIQAGPCVRSRDVPKPTVVRLFVSVVVADGAIGLSFHVANCVKKTNTSPRKERAPRPITSAEAAA